jgi:putative DNA primase/helicase
VSPPLPDGTPTSAEVLARIHEHGPIFPESYDQARALGWKPERHAVKRYALAPDVAIPPPTASSVSEAILVRLDTIAPQPIRWLWPGRIALGKPTLIAGDPGLGKSLIVIALAAHTSTGQVWPVDGAACDVGDVIIMSAEDDAADTLRPRFDAAGGDPKRISILTSVRCANRVGEPSERMFSLRQDLDALRLSALRLPACRLIVIDPISAYLDGTESHNNAEVRAVLAPLAKLAAEVGAAVVCVTHLNKGSQSSALYRATGSLAFVAAARAVFAVSKDKDNPSRRLILPMKNNLAPDTTGIAYAITAPHGVPAIIWEPEPVTITADEALGPERRLDDEDSDRPARDEAGKWLLAFLAEGPRGAKEAYTEARAVGISAATLRRAKDELPIDSFKEGFGPLGIWLWRLEGAHSALPNMSSEHLSQEPHGTGLPAKAPTEQDRQEKGEHVSVQTDDPERF